MPQPPPTSMQSPHSGPVVSASRGLQLAAGRSRPPIYPSTPHGDRAHTHITRCPLTLYMTCVHTYVICMHAISAELYFAPRRFCSLLLHASLALPRPGARSNFSRRPGVCVWTHDLSGGPASVHLLQPPCLLDRPAYYRMIYTPRVLHSQYTGTDRTEG